MEFRTNLESYVGEKISSGVVRRISVYFRDLDNNGPTFGIGEDDLFSPASMLKLPVLFAYFARSESDPSLLSREITISKSAEEQDGHDPADLLQAGSTYTIDELLRRMIIYSDNESLHLLLAFLRQMYPDEDVFADTLAAIGIAKSEGSEDDFLTVKRNASLYRALYNASFLSKEMSQRALDLLTRTAAPVGIREGVPEGVMVAHKFGIRESEGQLHDCGIVYHPKNHYLLCIMTQGEGTPMQSTIIADISRMIFEEVSQRVE